MLLNSLKEKSDAHKKLNKNIILKKTLSELNIKVKNKRHNNILPINSLSTTNRFQIYLIIYLKDKIQIYRIHL